MIANTACFTKPEELFLIYRIQYGLEVIVFPDPLLDRTIRAAITDKVMPTNYIYDIDIDDIGFIYPSYLCITNLEGIEHLDKLTSLYLHDTCVTDITPLAYLTNLDLLYIFNNNISNIAAVSNLSRLVYLYAYENNIEDVSPVSGLTMLKDLLLDNNNIEDVSALSGLTNLVDLSLVGNRIVDIAPLIMNASNGGLGEGDRVDINGNILADTNQITVLRSYGVGVTY